MRSRARSGAIPTHATHESGATLVEILVVVAILGILSNLAIHSALEYRRRSQAARVVTDFRLFRDAVIQHYENAGTWPPDVTRRSEPPELERLLKGRLRWSHPELGIEYEWDNWVGETGRFAHPETGVARGFSVVIPKRRKSFEHLLADIERIYDGPLVRVGRKRLTFVIDPIYPPFDGRTPGD